jgi:hypothetical protein
LKPEFSHFAPPSNRAQRRLNAPGQQPPDSPF